ncbi:cullin-3-like [Teleopsis dalmanni]|uniref:cullin-3-like n=1 Tax=Teleopsis dalmanni TaxID=139649 RepID=UPI0018CD6BF8|nr:cullin-3-like [Teleopsis dalmanni]
MYLHGSSFYSSGVEQSVETLWASLKNAMQMIQKKSKSKFSFERLYRNAHYMILYNQGNRLYSGVREVISEHLKQSVRQCLIKNINNNFLFKLNQEWNDHKTSMLMIRDILMYMDRVYVEKENLQNVFNLGLILFRDEIIKYTKLKNVLSDCIMEMIQIERCGEVINHLLMKNVCQMLLSLDFNSHSLYEEIIEKPFLAKSVSFYKLKSQELLAGNNACIYLKEVNAYIQAESNRTVLYLKESTKPHIVKIIQDELIKKHIQSIAEMETFGLAYMIENSKMDDLRTLYEVFSQYNEEGLNVIADTMSAYLLDEGRKLVIEEEMNIISPITFIQKILDLKKQFYELVHYSFNDDVEIKLRISTAIEHFIILNKKSPECLSLFINNKLATGAKLITEQEFEKVLDETMFLFKLLQEKDAFERYYQIHLAKRLIQNKYVSYEFEKNMISKLKIEYGYEYTLKLDKMLKDMSASNTIIKEFKDHVNKSNLSLPKVELEIRVLTMGFWPINAANLNCNLPLAASEAFEYFKIYFLNQRSNRKLVLQPQLGNAFINAEFYGQKIDHEKDDSICAVNSTTPQKRRKHLLQVSTHQMSILMLFNNRQVLTYLDIQQETDIPEKNLLRSLESLCMQKQRILARRSKTQTENIDPTDEFYVNDAFTHKNTKIKILNVAAKDEKEADRRQIRDKVDEDRKHEIDSAIVRIMKARKRMAHNELIVDVTSQLKKRFLPSPMFIKKRIENLIEREYIARTPEDNKMYIYLA